MSKYQLTRKAVDDLANIWEYTINVWSEKQADKYYQLLVDTFQEIANSPQLGRHYEAVSKNLLGFRIKKHIIFYRIVDQDSIRIIRILHQRMDLKRRTSE